MKRFQGLALGLVVIGATAACDLMPWAEPKSDQWHLSFVNTTSSMYGGAACTSTTGDLYCKTWVPDTHAFTGVLRRGTHWTLEVPEGDFSAFTSAGIDTVIVELDESATSCAYYQLMFRSIRDSIFGTFSHTADCHGAGNYGTFTGKP